MTDAGVSLAARSGICLEEYAYPYPVRFLAVYDELQPVRELAYMDIPPSGEANGKTVVLMHGKALLAPDHFQNVIEALTGLAPTG